MSALVIKNLPEPVMMGLKARARANHRSVTKEAVVLLASGIGETLDFSTGAAAPAASPGGSGPSANPSDGRAALRAALVKQPGGGYVNLLGYDGPSFDDALALARSAMRPPELPDFGSGDGDDLVAGG